MLDSRDESWVKQVLDVTDGAGVVVNVDMLSGDIVNKNMEATAIHRYVINNGRLAAMTGEFDFDLHARRRLHYIGTTGRTCSIDEAAEVARMNGNEHFGKIVMLPGDS